MARPIQRARTRLTRVTTEEFHLWRLSLISYGNGFLLAQILNENIENQALVYGFVFDQKEYQINPNDGKSKTLVIPDNQ